MFPDTMLAPYNVLSRDVRDLAGNLGFDIDLIHFISQQERPFLHLLDYWCKIKDDNDATMENLRIAVVDLKRPDVLELLDKAIIGLSRFLCFLRQIF